MKLSQSVTLSTAREVDLDMPGSIFFASSDSGIKADSEEGEKVFGGKHLWVSELRWMIGIRSKISRELSRELSRNSGFE